MAVGVVLNSNGCSSGCACSNGKTIPFVTFDGCASNGGVCCGAFVSSTSGFGSTSGFASCCIGSIVADRTRCRDREVRQTTCRIAIGGPSTTSISDFVAIVRPVKAADRKDSVSMSTIFNSCEAGSSTPSPISIAMAIGNAACDYLTSGSIRSPKRNVARNACA